MSFTKSSLDRMKQAILNKTKYRFSPNEMRAVAELVVRGIQTKTRIGRSPVTDSKFPGLKQITIERRKEIAKHNKTHETFSPGFSNLTITGALVDSIRFKLFTNEQRIEFTVPGKHPGYNLKSGGRTKPVSFSTIMMAQREMGRDFLGLSDKHRKMILEELKRIIRRGIKREFASRF